VSASRCRPLPPQIMLIDAEVAVSDELPLVVTVAVIVAVVKADAVTNVKTALLPLPLMVAPVGVVQVTKLAGIVSPLSVTTVAVTVPGGVTVVLFRFMVMLLIVPVMTLIGTAVLLFPLHLTVTVA
jgi:hypothetical protein